MKPIFLFSALSIFALISCSTTESVCEDITIASEQIQECQSLQRQIASSKDRPLIRTELERRYQVDCIDIRYYRDDKQKAICGNKHKMSEMLRAVKTESSAKIEIVTKPEVSKVSLKSSFTKADAKQLSFTATVKYMNLEGGFFGLISKEGKHWLPMNLKKEFQQNGAVIAVRGNAIEGMMTIQQWGTPFSITHIELIKAGESGSENYL
jgi:hypothetical protein